MPQSVGSFMLQEPQRTLATDAHATERPKRAFIVACAPMAGQRYLRDVHVDIPWRRGRGAAAGAAWKFRGGRAPVSTE